jgi:hypothetical protein
MPAPSELEPSMVSAADLSKLEDELLTVYTKTRIGSGAYSGSSHVTNPSTSSLPDPHSFRVYRFAAAFFPFNVSRQMHAITFLAHHQQLPVDGTLVFLDLFRRLLALQTLHTPQLLILFAQSAMIRSYSQFSQLSLFINTDC